MSNKFANIPLDSDTTILEEKPITLEGLEAFYQKWRWDGITAESVIFASADINHLDDSELELLITRSNRFAFSSSMTVKRNPENYTFINFNFKSQ
ncbi:hypothetical protein [Advenella alkanexedens]|uniref:hypothetical protein n=1 Tax=Advenella alkanexedens TaxID=1481665 RepID=UPI002675196B|nr:hypothetical protein [Advenella alkanexedens]WKU20119.1 hypothetical protein Q3V95_03505 [Advenella alkanexedens]